MAFLSIQIHIVLALRSKLTVSVRFCQAPTSPSLLGPVNPPLFLSLATASTSSSYCGSRGSKDSRSMVGLSNKSLFDISSMVLIGVMLISPWVKESKQGQSRLGTNLGREKSAWDLGRKNQNKLQERIKVISDPDYCHSPRLSSLRKQ